MRDRLDAAEDKRALMRLEMIHSNALEEFHQLTRPGGTITVNGMTINDVKRHSMSDVEKETVVFELGWECLKNADMKADGTYIDSIITLHRLSSTPHCAMLHVIAMIENMTDGNGESSIMMRRFNFILEDDINGEFKQLISTMPLFYPKVLIGRIDSQQPEEKAKDYPVSGIEKYNLYRDMICSNNPKFGNLGYSGFISYLQNTRCYILSPVLAADRMKQIVDVLSNQKDKGVALRDELLNSGLFIPMTTINPRGERRLAVFLTEDQIPQKDSGMIRLNLDFKLACTMAKSMKDIGAIVIDYSSPKSITLLPEMIDTVLETRVVIEHKDESCAPTQNSSPNQECRNDPTNQQNQWIRKGLCGYCGGEMGGLFSKKCKVCGKPRKNTNRLK